ncbi:MULTISPECIES: hypothetical protein [Bacillus]|uniref:hypothetical protein n=2 Tax=Bacillaceae TaxID=186817 RepID=UPI000BEDFDA2|nr:MULTISPECIES: hypothetical protein [Bacillus]MDA1754685.1 hypothetical protein [Bacillus cereus]MDA2120593.1 hypothetical protein [Bacillus cereus]MDA2142168.1 hypothetical protein [Bacillus cereus group sp. Bc248]MDA2170500.1 hypothetical protein [Bacillus cereus group sp. Bc247]MDA2729793.1 hypothetical protein [Bacillus cereus]
MLIFYVIPLFLISGISIFLFFLSVSPKIKAKNLSLIIICLAINVLTIPISCLVGSFVSYKHEASTEFIYNNPLYFWKGFFFIQIIPFFVLFVALIWWFIRKGKEKIET